MKLRLGRGNPVRKFWILLVTAPLLALGCVAPASAASPTKYTITITFNKVHFPKFDDCELNGGLDCENGTDLMGGFGVHSYSAYNFDKSTRWITTANWPQRWEDGGWHGQTKQEYGDTTLYPVNFAPAQSTSVVGLCQAPGYNLEDCYKTKDVDGNETPSKITDQIDVDFYPWETVKFDVKAKWMDYDKGSPNDTLCDLNQSWSFPNPAASIGDYRGVVGSGWNGDGQCDIDYTFTLR